jgi:hypothetical protein
MEEDNTSESEEEGCDKENELEEEPRVWPHVPAVAGRYVPPPSVKDARLALEALKSFLKPAQATERDYKDVKLDLLLQSRLEKLKMFLWNYTDPTNRNPGWMAVSLKTAHAFEKGLWLAGRLHERAHAYISDHDNLPLNVHGTWNTSILEDKDFAQELQLHLQGIGKYVRASDIVHYIARPEVLAQLKLTKTISLVTAQCWMKTVGYH